MYSSPPPGVDPEVLKIFIFIFFQGGGGGGGGVIVIFNIVGILCLQFEIKIGQK